MGGGEISLMDVMASLRARQPDWRLDLVAGEDGPLVQQARDIGVNVVLAPFPAALARSGDSGSGAFEALWSGLRAGSATMAYKSALRRILANLDPDIVHTNGFKMHILGAWTRPKKASLVWHVRDYVSTRPVMKRLLAMNARKCAAAIGNSQSVAKDIRKVCGRRLETVCIYNAIDLKRFSPWGPKTDLDAMAGFHPAPAGTVRIGLVATLAHWKGHEVFLRALARMPKDLPFRAYVVGGPIYQTERSQRTLDELRVLAASLKIGDRVGFTEYIADTAGAIRALDVLVHASTQPEPFGRVIAEGMACGRAVISSATGGAAELIQEGEDALSHPPGDDAALAERLTQVTKNLELRLRLGRAARTTAERRFDRSRLADQIIPFYTRLRGLPALQRETEMAAAH